MTCPFCRRPLRRIELLLTVEHECSWCGVVKPSRSITGFTLVDHCLAGQLQKQSVLMMVYRDVEAAAASLSGMIGAVVYEVELEEEPAWTPRLKRPEHMVASVLVRMVGGKLVGETGK